jgi:undecaprenyl-diphosphatase
MILLIKTLILSIIQGITEWFPVSSSGHLAILHNFFGFQNLAFDVFLHFAGIFALIILFRKEIISLLDVRKKQNLKYILLIIIGAIPAGIMGFLFKSQIEGFFSNLLYLGIFFIISGILVYSTKFAKESEKEINLFDSLFIGIFQAIAILPGISRSGATISSGLFRGLKKEDAVKFSFLLAIPVILGASLLELKNLAFSEINYFMLISSFLMTFFTSIFAIKFLLKIIKSDKFYLFGIYNFILGVLVLILSFFY